MGLIMDTDELRQQALALRKQITALEEELAATLTQIAQQTFWLKAGDVIRRSGYQKKIFGNSRKWWRRERCLYNLVLSVSALVEYEVRSPQIRVCVIEEDGTICGDHVGYLNSYQENLQRIGHVDDWETVECINLRELEA
jgi:hypothetical protein